MGRSEHHFLSLSLSLFHFKLFFNSILYSKLFLSLYLSPSQDISCSSIGIEFFRKRGWTRNRFFSLLIIGPKIGRTDGREETGGWKNGRRVREEKKRREGEDERVSFHYQSCLDHEQSKIKVRFPSLGSFSILRNTKSSPHPSRINFTAPSTCIQVE